MRFEVNSEVITILLRLCPAFITSFESSNSIWVNQLTMGGWVAGCLDGWLDKRKENLCSAFKSQLSITCPIRLLWSHPHWGPCPLSCPLTPVWPLAIPRPLWKPFTLAFVALSCCGTLHTTPWALTEQASVLLAFVSSVTHHDLAYGIVQAGLLTIAPHSGWVGS